MKRAQLLFAFKREREIQTSKDQPAVTKPASRGLLFNSNLTHTQTVQLTTKRRMRIFAHIVTIAIALLCPSQLVARVESRFIFDATRCVELDEQQLDKNTIHKLQSIGTLFPNGVFCYDIDNSKSAASNDDESESESQVKLPSSEDMSTLLAPPSASDPLADLDLTTDLTGGSSRAGDDDGSTLVISSSIDAEPPSRLVKKSRELRIRHSMGFRPYQPFRVGGTIYRGKKKMKVAAAQQQQQ